jgi:hypothetical protein
MVTIYIAEDFAKNPGARNYDDGPKSGREFFDTLLKKKFIEAVEQKTKLNIILDGTTGYASSFLNESFSLLGTEFGADDVWDRLIITSIEIPKYILKIKESVYEIRK